MNEFEIIGITGSEKNDKKFYRIYLAGDFSDYSHTHCFRCDGCEVITEVTSFDCYKFNVGDTVRLFYTRGFEGKARLAGIEKVTAKNQ